MAADTVRINITFAMPVEISKAAHQTLHDALDMICADYERANPDRIMWAAGEGGQPPPGWYFDEPQGDWDMSILNIEVSERERYETDRRPRMPKVEGATVPESVYLSAVHGRREMRQALREALHRIADLERQKEIIQSRNPTAPAVSAGPPEEAAKP